MGQALRRMGHRLRNSPKAALWMLVVGICLLLACLDGTWLWHMHGNQLGQTRRENINLARSLAQQAHATFEIVDAAVAEMQDRAAAGLEDAREITRLGRVMEARANELHPVQRLVAVDRDGVLVASSMPDAPAIHYDDRWYFRYHRDHPGLGMLLGPPVLSRLDGFWIVTVSRRVNAPDGSFAGVVLATVSTSLFGSFYDTIQIGHHGAITLLTDAGLVVAKRTGQRVLVGSDVSAGPVFTKIPSDQRDGTLTYWSISDKVERIGAYQRIQDFPLVSTLR